MCVEGLRAIPLGCYDCYDKDNVLGAGGWQAGWSRLWCLGWGGAGAAARGTARLAPPTAPCSAPVEEWQPSLEQLLSKHLGCCDGTVHHPGL